MDQNVRVGPDGVFVAARKVADLGQIVERIARTDVAEVGSPVRTRGSTGWAVSGAAAGFGLGFLAFCPGDCGAGSPLRFVAPLLFPIAGGLLAALAPVRAHGANGAWRTTGQGEHRRKRLQAGSWRQIDGWLWHQ